MNATFRATFPAILAAFAQLQEKTSGPGSAVLGLTGRLKLAKRSTVKLPRPLGRRIDCTSGSIWITVDGDRKDYILEAGESFVPTDDKLVMLQALDPSVICIA